METLIVDDDEMTTYLHKVFVTQNKFDLDPHVFYHGESTIEYLKENYDPNKIYCVFLDINMPIMDGWEFLEALNKENIKDNVWVVMLTSSVNPVDKQKANSYKQVLEYIEKPLNDSKLNLLKQNEHFRKHF
jgi:CheY-like chemotaxis protein